MASKDLEHLLSVPQILRDPKFWTFFGSGLIVSVAYMDPGNWGTNIEGGALYGYSLLWAVWLSSLMGILFQYLSGKLGIAGYSLPGLVKEKLGDKGKALIYWALAEIAILSTDLAEFLGVVVALNLLFGIPMVYGAFIAVLDVLVFLAISGRRFRAVEYAFMAFVGIIALSYVYEIFLTKPDLRLILYHSLVPTLTPQSLLLIVGIIGATVMPHALWVHSWLIKNKLESQEHRALERKKAVRYHLADCLGALTVAAFINAAMLAAAAAAFYGSGVATMGQAFKTLAPIYGNLAALVFAVGLLSAGLSSSITGTLAGQSIMESLTDFKLSPWVRRVITRFINLVPLLAALLLGLDPLSILVYSQVALSLLLPLAVVPLVIFSSDRKIMGELVNSRLTTFAAWAFTAVIVALNAYLLYATIFPG